MSTNRRASLASCAVLALSIAVAGCANDDASTKDTKRSGSLPPPKQLNKQTAESLVRDAEAAERAGDFARASECYEQLRSYPDASRPKDLDARINRVKEQIKKP